MLFVSYGFAFHDERHWVRGAQDLPLLPTIFGCLVGIFINFVVSKKKYTAVWVRDGSASPEARLVREYTHPTRHRKEATDSSIQHGSSGAGSSPSAC